MDLTITVDQLSAAFRAGLAEPTDLSAALDLLLSATGGNIVGMWRRIDQDLHVMCFRYDAEFPRDVAQAFAASTRVVSLEQTGLGIVHATLTAQPTVALLLSEGGLLPGSGGWLERFESVQSLSMPILRDETVIAVLALSTRFPFTSHDRTWTLMVALANELAALL
jgi:hypothetical protein